MTPDLLTKRQREILTIMRDKADSENGELVYSRGCGYLGFSPVSGRTVFALLRLCAISGVTSGDYERYQINETGRQLLVGQPPAELLKALRRMADN